MFAAIKAMMLDMLAAMARKDYDDRRRRQAEGITRAKAAEGTERNATMACLLGKGVSWSQIQAATRCGHEPVAKIARRRRAAVPFGGHRFPSNRGSNGMKTAPIVPVRDSRSYELPNGSGRYGRLAKLLKPDQHR
jgi:hypothetical protein